MKLILLLTAILLLTGCKDNCKEYNYIPFWVYNVALKMMVYQPIMTCVKYKEDK